MDDPTTADPYVLEEYRVTFGTKYDNRSWDTLHPQAPEIVHGNGYVAILAPDYGTARRAAVNLFSLRFAFLYRPGDYPEPRHTPLGELGRITINFPLVERDATTEYYEAPPTGKRES
jgi:hypothetical protein